MRALIAATSRVWGRAARSVAAQGDRATAHRSNSRARVLRFGLAIEPGDSDIGTGARVRLGYRAADAGVAAGDEGPLPAQYVGCHGWRLRAARAMLRVCPAYETIVERMNSPLRLRVCKP